MRPAAKTEPALCLAPCDRVRQGLDGVGEDVALAARGHEQDEGEEREDASHVCASELR